MGVVSARNGFRTLVISTDPAPSLGDAFGQALGPRPRRVRGVRGLEAVEVDGAAALGQWIESRRATLENIALRGTWLDRDDVSRLLRLSLPGIDEVAGLMQIAELGRSAAYDRIIVDTAPTGHLLRMLAMPSVLQGIAQVFDHMQARHRVMVEALRGRWIPDAADELIRGISEDAEDLRELFRDPARARVSWVTLPEDMAVEESADAIRWLTDQGIGVAGIIVNRVTGPPPQPCRWCRARRQVEHQAIETLKRAPGRRMDVIVVPAAEREPRGISALAAIGRWLQATPPKITKNGRGPSRVTAVIPPSETPSSAAVMATAETRLLMFGGKGGVGKTTCAVAGAVDIALTAPNRRVLLLSTDPAHSIGDALGHAFSDVPGLIRGGPSNLRVRELDAGRVFDSLRDRFAAAVEALFSRVAGSLDGSLVSHDRQVVRDLLELAPPGVDELIAIVEVTDALVGTGAAPAFDLVVMDTAPTGHALRLLEMPALVHEWVKAIMAILLKYQPVAGLGSLGELLLQVSQGLGRLRTVLRDPDRTRFVVVTRPAALPRAETLRLVKRLAAVSMRVPVVLVNAVGGGTCSRCRKDVGAQRREIVALRKDLGKTRTRRPTILICPAEMPPPHGRDRLREWRRTWRESSH